MSEPKTIFEACVEALKEENGNPSLCDETYDLHDLAVSGVRTVIQTIIDLTQSPRTVDELTAILREADAS